MFAQEITPILDTSWESKAACRTDGASAALFFSEDLSEIAAAKRICATCPVMAQCLEQAIHNQEPWGVWGGQLFCNGKMLMVKRRRGRPPKHPRPEDQLPVIPIPDHLRGLVRTA
jgi:WhiB family redox-sensing transcriptional regulator